MEKILIVEDDVIAQMTLSQMICEMGYPEPIAVGDSETALGFLSRESVNLVIMDVFIRGGMSGVELTGLVNIQYPDIPVIYLTASSDSRTFEKISKTRHHGVLEKPYSYEEIHEKIRGVLKQKQEHLDQPGQEEVDAELRLENEPFEEVFNAIALGLCITDINKKYVRVNDVYCSIFGLNRNELIGKEFLRHVSEEDRDRVSKLYDEYSLFKRDSLPAESRVVFVDGNILDLWITMGRFIGNDGKVYIVSTVMNNSERKKYINRLKYEMEENQRLIQEIHHRVKNNLNTINGLLYLQEGVYTDVTLKNALRSVRQRVHVLSFIHHKFFKGTDLIFLNSGEFVPELSESLQTSFKFEESVEISYEIEDHQLDNQVALDLGLVLNELISNVFMHAYSEHTEPKKVDILFRKEANRECYLLEIRDNGVGIGQQENGDYKTLGFKLISYLVSKDNFKLFNENGTRASVVFPFIGNKKSAHGAPHFT